MKWDATRFQKLDWTKLTGRERVLSVVTAGALVFGIYLMVLQPAKMRVRQYEAEVTRLTGELSQKETIVAQLESRAREIREAEKSGEVTRELSIKAPDILPGGSRLSSFLEELTRLARQRRVEFVSIRPESVRDEGAYLQLSLRIDVKAHFRQFGEYLAMVEDLPRAIIVEEIGVESGNEISPFVLGHLKAVTFLAKE